MKHTSVIVLAVAAVILAAVGLRLVVRPRGHDHRPTAGTPATSAPAVPRLPSETPVSPLPETADPIGEPDAPPSRKAFSDESIQRGLEATWPGSPLPTGQERELVALGWSVVRADLTGRGRERWPAYFPEGTSRTRYTAVRMRAGVARAVSARADLAQVIVIWTGKDPQGRKIDQKHQAVCLAWDGSRWHPRLPFACTASQ